MTETFNQGCMLITGGAKSGKSRIALDICNKMGKKLIFLATAQAFDKEMEERISRHQEERGTEWSTIEEPVDIIAAISKSDNQDTVILFDCFTLWLNNLYMLYKNNPGQIEREIDKFISMLPCLKGAIVVVSNETGMGIVPDNVLSRRYRDDAGRANQKIARVADKVITVISGLPLFLK